MPVTNEYQIDEIFKTVSRLINLKQWVIVPNLSILLFNKRD